MKLAESEINRALLDGEINFDPFETELRCPECSHVIHLYVTMIHMRETVECPMCMRPLSGIIRKRIREHLKINR